MSRIIHSRFFVTVNSNSTDIKYKSLLRKTFESLINQLEDYLIFRKTGHDKSKIDEITVDAASIEIGDEKKMVHLHALVHIVHHSNIQLDNKKIKDKFNKDLGISVHLDNQYVETNDVERIINYIRKGEGRFLFRK